MTNGPRLHELGDIETRDFSIGKTLYSQHVV